VVERVVVVGVRIGASVSLAAMVGVEQREFEKFDVAISLAVIVLVSRLTVSSW